MVIGHRTLKMTALYTQPSQQEAMRSVEKMEEE